jgi:CelD/BcsL family acetyltransferase involved in cellulose biosynthesis
VKPPPGTPKSALRFSLLKARELEPELIAIWSRIQEAEPTLASPYFRPEFTQEVAAVRTDVEVAVFDLGGVPVGFFPFQRGMLNIGRPVGSSLSDFQGVIVRSDVDWSTEELISRCRLAAWFFDHALSSQEFLAVHRSTCSISPYIDLSMGFATYQADRRREGSQTLSSITRKVRKAEREMGPVRLEAHTTSSEAWDAFLKWKIDQYRRTEAVNTFAQAWRLSLLRRILERRDAAFSGMLSALFIGDRIAAVHLGMRSFGVLHWWFPAYNPALREYSPGLILLARLAQASEELGIRRIDLGKGTERYKTSLMSGATAICEGSVVCSRSLKAALQSWRGASRWIRSSPLHPVARMLAGALRRGGLNPPDGST